MSSINEKEIIVSTIVPLYKGKKYVVHLIELCTCAYKNAGIVDQAELIFVNDYPDESVILPDSNFVRLVNNKKNVGIQKSRINGLKSSRGKWIHFLDQDDNIEECFYRIMLKKTDKNDVIIANAIIKDCGYDRVLYRNVIERCIAKHGSFYVSLDNRIISPGQCLIRKESIPDAWKHRYMEVNGADDLLLWLLMFDENCNFSVEATPLYIHEYTGDNLSSDKEHMNKSMNEMVTVYKECSLNHKYLKPLEKKVKFINGDDSSFIGKTQKSVLTIRKLIIQLSKKRHMKGKL